MCQAAVLLRQIFFLERQERSNKHTQALRWTGKQMRFKENGCDDLSSKRQRSLATPTKQNGLVEGPRWAEGIGSGLGARGVPALGEVLPDQGD